MNLRKKFFYLNTLIVLMTILITALAVVIFFAVYVRTLGNSSDIADFKRIVDIKTGFGEIKKNVQSSPVEEPINESFKDVLKNKVERLEAIVLIVKNKEAIFYNKSVDKLDMEKCLELSKTGKFEDTIKLSGKTYMFDRADFRFSNGEKGVMLLLAPLKLRGQYYMILISLSIVCFILAFIGVNMWVTIIFSKGVIKPVVRLKNAAKRISMGDLGHGIPEEGEGEVRELCKVLEQMRLKLKESVYLQEKYDENRKFLMSSISHDLKTPVTSIKGYVEGVIDGVANTPDKINLYLETARNKAILVNSMIDDLLLCSRLDMNQIPFNFERTDIFKYFDYCVSENQMEFAQGNMKLILEGNAQMNVFVNIDRDRFKRIIQNILDNAKKYNDKALGEVVIALRETKTSIVIEIRDNGQGINDDELTRIFDRFYRSDSSRDTTGGSGLGLAIAKQIVEGHGGRIWASSILGKGTSIYISIGKEM